MSKTDLAIKLLQNVHPDLIVDPASLYSVANYFFYDDSRRQPCNAAGAGPIIIDLQNNNVFSTSSGHTDKEHLTSLEKLGHPHGLPSEIIQINAIGPNKAKVISLLKNLPGVTTEICLDLIHSITKSGKAIVTTTDTFEAAEYTDKLLSIECEAEQVWV